MTVASEAPQSQFPSTGPVSPVRIPPRPFLKWAGGKTGLLEELQKRTPQSYGTYFEPFLGGGAFFFSLLPTNAVLSDIGGELVNCFLTVRNNVEELITELQTHKHTKKHFYNLRQLDRRADYWLRTPVEKASRFIFLNKTCFNGLYRVNSRGEFNVPFGSYKNPKIFDADNLRACSRALNRAQISKRSFEAVLDNATSGDFVYFDPPYVPLNETSNFTSYAEDGFSLERQAKLADVCAELDRKGVKFMLSNSHTEFVLEAYRKFRVDTVYASRAINSVAANRGKVAEVVVTNY
ncbi:MAG: DNA adenine methylase [Deltaproteobacteria bacterium]|nr:DNA adenine methylase [Deltaproteobacteria bacterium]